MQLKRILKNIAALFIVTCVCYGVHYCNVSFPIISGYGAKDVCSGVFISNRNPQDIIAQELGKFPLSLGSFEINYQDSSVTGSVIGLAKCKAIYRKGLGVTLLADMSEEELRNQHFALATPPHINQDTVCFPMGNKLTDSVPDAVDIIKLQQALQSYFTEKDTLKPMRTRAVIVVYNGNLVYEQYAHGYTKDSKLIGWSMTKSVTSALIGILVKNEKLNLDAPAPVPEWESVSDLRHAITLKNLLQQCSGLNFLEDYTKSSDATNMLFRNADMAAYTASRPLKYKPGSTFYYSSGNTNILSRIIRQTVGEDTYHAFPYDSLFYPLGMYSAILEPDASGTYVGSSYMYATARDWARFGLLYLNKGLYANKRILTEDWVRQSATPATSTTQGDYGFQFWLNAGTKDNPNDRVYPHAPTDLYYMDGFEGQRVFIVPSKKLVVVRLGLTQYKNFDSDAFIADVISSIK
ncbi:MAG: serine hydrolase domain-containing protein [Bacteroidia bacterium]